MMFGVDDKPKKGKTLFDFETIPEREADWEDVIGGKHKAPERKYKPEKRERREQKDMGTLYPDFDKEGYAQKIAKGLGNPRKALALHRQYRLWNNTVYYGQETKHKIHKYPFNERHAVFDRVVQILFCASNFKSADEYIEWAASADGIYWKAEWDRLLDKWVVQQTNKGYDNEIVHGGIWTIYGNKYEGGEVGMELAVWTADGTIRFESGRLKDREGSPDMRTYTGLDDWDGEEVLISLGASKEDISKFYRSVKKRKASGWHREGCVGKRCEPCDPKEKGMMCHSSYKMDMLNYQRLSKKCK